MKTGLGQGINISSNRLGDPVDFVNTSAYGRWNFQPGNISQSAGAISQANDLTSHAYHVTQGTAAQKPTLVTAGWNGRDIARFVNALQNVRLVKASGLALASGNAFSLYVVWKVDVGADASRFITAWSSTDSLGQNGVNVELYSTTNTRRVRWKNAAGADVGITTFGTYTLGTKEIWSVRVAAASQGGAATSQSYRVNGQAVSPTGTPAVFECQAGTRNVFIGNRNVTGGTPSEDIAELIAFDSYVDDSTNLRIEAALNQKWAVY